MKFFEFFKNHYRVFILTHKRELLTKLLTMGNILQINVSLKVSRDELWELNCTQLIRIKLLQVGKIIKESFFLREQSPQETEKTASKSNCGNYSSRYFQLKSKFFFFVFFVRLICSMWTTEILKFGNLDKKLWFKKKVTFFLVICS